MRAFLQEFGSAKDVADKFKGTAVVDLKGAKIHVAWYGYGSYCGKAFVLYEKDRVLYEVNGSHCSCYGLEGQWRPERTSWTALRRILDEGSKFDGQYYDGADSAEARLRQVVAEGSGLPFPAEGRRPRPPRAKRQASVVSAQPGVRKMRLGEDERGG